MDVGIAFKYYYRIKYIVHPGSWVQWAGISAMLYLTSRASNLIHDTASKEMLLHTGSCHRALGSLEEPQSTVGIWIRKRSQVTALKTCLWGSELAAMLAVMGTLAITVFLGWVSWRKSCFPTCAAEYFPLWDAYWWVTPALGHGAACRVFSVGFQWRRPWDRAVMHRGRWLVLRTA